VKLDDFEDRAEHSERAFFGHLTQDSTVFVQNGQRYRKAEALFLPSLQNLKRRALPKDPETMTLVSRIALITSGGAWL
jgi:hypothetical protein